MTIKPTVKLERPSNLEILDISLTKKTEDLAKIKEDNKNRIMWASMDKV